MNLITDQGNTSTKYAVISDGKIVFRQGSPDFSDGIINNIRQKYPVKNIFICSVRNDYAGIKELAGEFTGVNTLFFDDKCRLPVNNQYATPKTLGKDRLAAVCGAIKLFPGENCLVVDAGTCITYEFIDKDKNYHGGSISPGLEMRLKAMHEYTGKLPLVPLEWVDDFTGNSTQTSLQTGVIYGVVNEINGFIKLYQNRWKTLKVLLCGGDTVFLAKRFENEIFAVSDLVLFGLNEILKHNIPDAQ